MLSHFAITLRPCLAVTFTNNLPIWNILRPCNWYIGCFPAIRCLLAIPVLTTPPHHPAADLSWEKNNHPREDIFLINILSTLQLTNNLPHPHHAPQDQKQDLWGLCQVRSLLTDLGYFIAICWPSSLARRWYLGLADRSDHRRQTAHTCPASSLPSASARTIQDFLDTCKDSDT